MLSILLSLLITPVAQDTGCTITQAQLDAEYQGTGGYEIQVEELCTL